MTRRDKAPPGWRDQNAEHPLEVEVEVAACPEFRVRLAICESDRPGMSRDDCERIARGVGESVGPLLVAALRARGITVL